MPDTARIHARIDSLIQAGILPFQVMMSITASTLGKKTMKTKWTALIMRLQRTATHLQKQMQKRIKMNCMKLIRKLQITTTHL